MDLIIILGLIVIFAVISLVVFVLSLKNILKNKKLFKYVFKKSKPLLLKEIFQILLIVILSVILLLQLSFVCSFFGKIFSCDNAPTCGYECPVGFKQASSRLNIALTLEKQLVGSISYNSVQDYATVFTKRFNLSDLKYLKTDVYDYTEYSKSEIRKANLQDFVGKPIIIDVNTMYMFKKFQNQCKTVDIENIENNDCIMVIDANRFRKPNKITVDARKPKDRYFLIINGNNDTVISPKMYHSYLN